jgi:hypothetical protein
MSASHIPRRLVQHKLVMLGLPADQAQKGLVTYSSSHDKAKMTMYLLLHEQHQSQEGIDPAVHLSGV